MAIHLFRKHAPAAPGMGRTDDWPSGVPRPGRLGAARNELIAIALAILVLAIIAISFWFEAYR